MSTTSGTNGDAAAAALPGLAVPITSAIGPGNMSAVFFVDRHKNIKFFRSEQEPERPKGSKGESGYRESYVYKDRENDILVDTDSTNLAALSYSSKDPQKSKIHTRLYYADKNGKLCELCLDQDKDSEKAGNWYDGSLNGKDIKVLKNSPISVHVNESKNKTQLKVYYFADAKSDKPNVVFVTLYEQDWDSKVIS